MTSEKTSPLKLFGTWSSSYTHRVQLALKLKGLEFEYVEEDLSAKSPSLLLYNPVHQKVPVLLHGGRPLAESIVILQYIDETWRESPLMPRTPTREPSSASGATSLTIRVLTGLYDGGRPAGRAVAAVFRTTAEEQKAAVAEVHQNLAVMEGELREGHFKGRRFFGGEKLGLLDVVVGCGSFWLSIFEEVADVKLIDEESFPLFHGWLRQFEAQEAVKETIPPPTGFWSTPGKSAIISSAYHPKSKPPAMTAAELTLTLRRTRMADKLGLL
ncbi:unnamed protein product [Spirodela intermedia]|uniref:glutathione transferase n=1 Tax=Spirodela intermedia TaxID=51605 RepID=A0A7I8JG52_SPIIN|nr:unnamed protein product [Spirodela intermedia]CAA6669140.1 unnamed protein product [Spirodela intermedia]